MEELAQLELWRRLVVLVPLGAVTLVCAYTDLRERKVYNKITYPAFFVGLVAHTVAMGFGGLLDGLIAAAIAFGLGLLVMLLRVMGGGDVKLLIVIGAFLGLSGLGQVFFYSILAGGVGGMLVALFNGYLWEMLKRVGRFLRGLVRMAAYRSGQVREPLEKDERSWVPFAIYIFIGTVLSYLDVVEEWPGLWRRFTAILAG